MSGNAHNGAMLSPAATEIECYPSGAFVDVRNPDPSTIQLADIAHHLATTSRYNGATAVPYSVASHSLLVCDLLASEDCSMLVQREGLMHDAAEAYLGDLCSPVKYALRSEEFDYPGDIHRASVLSDFRGAWSHLESRVDEAIRAALLPPDLVPEGVRDVVRRADMWALFIEAKRLTASGGEGWRWPGVLPYDGDLPPGVQLVRHDWLLARKEFAKRARALGVDDAPTRARSEMREAAA